MITVWAGIAKWTQATRSTFALFPPDCLQLRKPTAQKLQTPATADAQTKRKGRPDGALSGNELIEEELNLKLLPRIR